MNNENYRTFRHPTFFLSISKKGLRCSEVAEFMNNKMHVPCSVTGNYSVQCSSSPESKKKCDIERGCRIVFQEDQENKVEEVWENLKEEFDLKCAHLEGRVHFNGCIYDYLKPSSCPGYFP